MGWIDGVFKAILQIYTFTGFTYTNQVYSSLTIGNDFDWHKISLLYNAIGRFDLYIDDVLQTPDAYDDAVMGVSPSCGFYIGVGRSNSAPNDTNVSAKIDELKVYLKP
jgi:hypothetical protein